MLGNWFRKVWNFLKKIGSKTAGLILSAAIVALIIQTAFRDVAVIRPISVPAETAAKGYTPDVVSKVLLSQARWIVAEANSARSGQRFDSSVDQLDVSVPGLGVSLRPALSFLRTALGFSDLEISGSITEDSPGNYRLRLALNSNRDFSVDIVTHPGESIEQLLQRGAILVVRWLDPYSLASFDASRDRSMAFELLTQCLSDGSASCIPWAHNLIGLMYFDQKKYSEAIAEYRVALQASPSFGIALKNLGAALFVRNAPGDREAARTAYRLAYTAFLHHGQTSPYFRGPISTDPYDEFFLGVINELQYGMAPEGTRNCEAAAYWYRQAAAQGFGRAARNLGVLYREGCDSIKKDYSTALVWFERAATQGAVYAQEDLASMFERGEGLDKPDPQRALLWYREAAKHGSVVAEIELGFALEQGKGVSSDPVEAYAWYFIASGNLALKDQRQMVIDGLSRLRSKLTASQAAAAEQLIYNLEISLGQNPESYSSLVPTQVPFSSISTTANKN
jgi:TPR repeat protein